MVVWVFDDIGCLFAAVPPMDPFNNEEVRTWDGPCSVYHSLQFPSFLGTRVAEPDYDTVSIHQLATSPHLLRKMVENCCYQIIAKAAETLMTIHRW